VPSVTLDKSSVQMIPNLLMSNRNQGTWCDIRTVGSVPCQWAKQRLVKD
jgi:hypothetical protein